MFPIIVIIILSLDQFSKFIVSKSLLLNSPVPVIKGVFYLTLVHNRGAAFGVLKDQVPLFILAALIAVILIYFNLRKNKHRQPFVYNLSLGLILAGAFGNLIDRLLYGHVVDFLDFRIWPVFNIADSAISIGAVILGWTICFRKSVK